MLEGHVSEEILEESKYSFKTEIWSAGIILYEMITGKLPWTGKDKTSIELLKSI